MIAGMSVALAARMTTVTITYLGRYVDVETIVWTSVDFDIPTRLRVEQVFSMFARFLQCNSNTVAVRLWDKNCAACTLMSTRE